MTNAADQNRQLNDQITELRAQVARLQAAVQQTGPDKRTSSKSGKKMSPASKMGMPDDKSEMGMPSEGAMSPSSGAMGMKDDRGEMGGMSPAADAPMGAGMSMGDNKAEMGGMPMDSKGSASPAPAMGMCCMGRKAAGNADMSAMPSGTGSMAATSGPSSAMPGQPGVSHLYHIGSNGFFLNHSKHITLTPDQRMTLTHLKEKATTNSANEQRRIAQTERELYTLTGSDQPDTAKIQAKIAEIEKLRGDQRMNFISAVADASNVLTPEQRKALLGTMVASRK
ncbi:MAG: periplasmic heavy metal sensor [Acidobacteriota bacterium]|nr:periplasmic heavy metal sensor [Acidobacteriota bacterium]